MPADEHNASASAIGYLYQVNWCLVELLETAPVKPDQAISLETHDDGAWEDSGPPLEVLQANHHVGVSTGPGDKATATWKPRRARVTADQPTKPQGAAHTLPPT